MAYPRTIKSEGVNQSEQELIGLCNKTFLSLWTYPNVYTDEGITKNRQGKELCDLLVVFGNTIILFSDKSHKFADDQPIEISWKRWYRKSIVKSANQLLGAEKWIRENPDRLYLDKQCTQKFPIPIKDISKVTFLRILVARNSKSPAINYFRDRNSGSLMLNNLFGPEDNLNNPFVIGRVTDVKDSFIHVFDDETLEKILFELDTWLDFIRFMTFKERIMSSELPAVIAGDEQFLGAYQLTFDPERNKSSLVDKMREEEFGGFVIEMGMWEEYVLSDIYTHNRRMKHDSQIWDALLERVSGHILAGNPYGIGESVSDHAEALYHFANESRLSRYLLGRGIYTKQRQSSPKFRTSRMITSIDNPNKLFIFIFFPYVDERPYEEYREARVAIAYQYALVAKLKYADKTHFCIIASEPRGSDGFTEDFSVIKIPTLSNAEKKEVRELQREVRILTDNMTMSRFHQL